MIEASVTIEALLQALAQVSVCAADLGAMRHNVPPGASQIGILLYERLSECGFQWQQDACSKIERLHSFKQWVCDLDPGNPRPEVRP